MNPAYRSHFLSARDGLRLHVREYGTETANSTPVVCLPGLARTSADFDTLARALTAETAPPRRVLAIDYRGRGRSDYDPDWAHYEIKTELDDVLSMMAALGVPEAIIVGTSRGGLITMAMAPIRPTAIKGVVLNDIGPVIDAQGLIRIRGYVGKLPAPADWVQAANILKRNFGAQFPALDAAGWDGYARRTWKEVESAGKLTLVPDYDIALMKTLAVLDLEAPMPVLWPLFEALSHAPMLVLRGAHSDLLSQTTLVQMVERHPRCAAYTVEIGRAHV